MATSKGLCDCLFNREREHEKEGPSSNVKRKPLNMKEGGGLQSLFLSALVRGASVSNWPSSLMRVSKWQKQSGSLPFSLSYLLFSSTLSFPVIPMIALLIPNLTSPAFPVLQEYHTMNSSPAAIIRHLLESVPIRVFGWTGDIAGFDRFIWQGYLKLSSKEISSLELTLKLPKSNRVGSHHGGLNSRVPWSAAKENRAAFWEFLEEVTIPYGSSSMRLAVPRRHVVLQTGMSFLLISWVFAWMKVWKMVCGLSPRLIGTLASRFLTPPSSHPL